MKRYEDFNGKEIAPDTIVKIKEIDGKFRYFLVTGEPSKFDNYIHLTGKRLTKRLYYDYRTKRDYISGKLENIIVLGRREEYNL